MPKGKAKGGRRGETKAERAVRLAIARELPAIKAVAACCDGFRDEWRALGGDDHPTTALLRLWSTVRPRRAEGESLWQMPLELLLWH